MAGSAISGIYASIAGSRRRLHKFVSNPDLHVESQRQEKFDGLAARILLVMRDDLGSEFDAIKDRVLEGELKPGTKLTEEEIASIFDVGRARARQSLRLLAAIGVVTIYRNRGAFVASPTRTEAAHIYAARRMLECPAVALVAATRSSENVTVLRGHLEQQRAAVSRNERRTFLRLTLEFHSLLASMAGIPVVEL